MVLQVNSINLESVNNEINKIHNNKYINSGGIIMNPININNIVTNREFLVENEKFKTLFFKFEDGKGLPNHSHNGFATIQVVSGTVDIEFKNGEKFELKEGDFLPFDARIEHNVISKGTSKVLVTISQSLS